MVKKNEELYRLENITRVIEGEVEAIILRGISFKVNTHEFISIIGPSGSGKSSLLYMLGLLDMPSSGDFYFRGESMVGLTRLELAQIRLETLGFIFQFHFLLPELRGIENIRLPMERLGKLNVTQMKDRVDKVLESLGLTKDAYKYPHQLSGGQRQRVAIARALINEPMVILADEPTGSLDTENGDKVFKIFQDLVKNEGKTIIMVTHNPELAIQTDRQINIVDGHIRGE
ncbi:MAG: ABC transporter ATP-binding protein [Alphaproteobacteria bacterium]|nr:ABC transporter ATP-binding protein [Alphaproteobacteria bacterium]